MIRTMSYGGGVQSTACLVLAAQGKIDFPVFLFANVGDDSEDPATLEYMEKYAKPYAEKHGIELVELRKIRRDGNEETIYQNVVRQDLRAINIPIRMANGAPGNRHCTGEWKMKPILGWQKAHGATASNPAVNGLGISLDETHRMRMESGFPAQVLEYPLIDLRIKRDECKRIIDEAGLPVPPKSACYFCPFHSMRTWADMSRHRPGLFSKVVELETIINEKRAAMDKDQVYFTRFAVPLSEVTEQYEIQGDLFGDYDGIDVCESGHCRT